MKDPVLSVRINDIILNKLDKLADEYGVNRAHLVKSILCDYTKTENDYLLKLDKKIDNIRNIAYKMKKIKNIIEDEKMKIQKRKKIKKSINNVIEELHKIKENL